MTTPLLRLCFETTAGVRILFRTILNCSPPTIFKVYCIWQSRTDVLPNDTSSAPKASESRRSSLHMIVESSTGLVPDLVHTEETALGRVQDCDRKALSTGGFTMWFV